MACQRRLSGGRDLQVARKNAGDDGVIGRALHVGVTPERVDASSRPADVAEDELEDRRRPDDLAPHGVHRPAHRVHDGADPVGRPRGADDLRHGEELLGGATRDLRDDIGRVPAVVALHQLEDAAGVLERHVPAHEPVGTTLVLPSRPVVSALSLVESREKTVLESETFFNDERGIGVEADVFLVEEPFVEDLVNHPAQDRDVGAGANLKVMIGDGRGARVTGVDCYDLGAALIPGLECPLEPAGVILRRVRAHDQHDVGVLDILPVVGHGAPPERCGQTGHCGAVSYTGLVVDVDQPHGAHRLGYEVGVLVGHGGASHPADALAPIDCPALGVLLHERGVSRILELPGEPVHREVPGDIGPLRSARLTVFGALLEAGAHGELHLGGPLRAERPTVDRAVRIALHVDDGVHRVEAAASVHISDCPAPHRAVRTHRLEFPCVGDLELVGGRVGGLQVEAQRVDECGPPCEGRGFKEVSAGDVRGHRGELSIVIVEGRPWSAFLHSRGWRVRGGRGQRSDNRKGRGGAANVGASDEPSSFWFGGG